METTERRASSAGASCWGEEVVTGTVGGHPCRLYTDRPASITAVLDQAGRWPARPFIVQSERVVTFAEHERMVRRIARQLRASGVALETG